MTVEKRVLVEFLIGKKLFIRKSNNTGYYNIYVVDEGEIIDLTYHIAKLICYEWNPQDGVRISCYDEGAVDICNAVSVAVYGKSDRMRYKNI